MNDCPLVRLNDELERLHGIRRLLRHGTNANHKHTVRNCLTSARLTVPTDRLINLHQSVSGGNCVTAHRQITVHHLGTRQVIVNHLLALDRRITPRLIALHGRVNIEVTRVSDNILISTMMMVVVLKSQGGRVHSIHTVTSVGRRLNRQYVRRGTEHNVRVAKLAVNGHDRHALPRLTHVLIMINVMINWTNITQCRPLSRTLLSVRLTLRIDGPARHLVLTRITRLMTNFNDRYARTARRANNQCRARRRNRYRSGNWCSAVRAYGSSLSSGYLHGGATAGARLAHQQKVLFYSGALTWLCRFAGGQSAFFGS